MHRVPSIDVCACVCVCRDQDQIWARGSAFEDKSTSSQTHECEDTQVQAINSMQLDLLIKRTFETSTSVLATHKTGTCDPPAPPSISSLHL